MGCGSRKRGTVFLRGVESKTKNQKNRVSLLPLFSQFSSFLFSLKMANTSCVDSKIFHKRLGEVKASKKTKASKITHFIDDNFYNDAVK